MFNKGVQNRPMKFGPNDRHEFIVQDTEVSLICINDSNGNPLFMGRAKAGIALDEDKWQIRQIQYDSNQGVTRVLWPEDSDNNPSTNYEFAWSSVAVLTVTGITRANPAVVTVSSVGSLANGDLVILQNVAGMTEVNYDGSNVYTVSGLSGSTFQLQGINSTGYTAYTSGGTVNYGEFIAYTYG